VKNILKRYSGHRQLPDVPIIPGITVSANPATPGAKVFIDLDGEQPGLQPATWEVAHAEVDFARLATERDGSFARESCAAVGGISPSVRNLCPDSVDSRIRVTSTKGTSIARRSCCFPRWRSVQKQERRCFPQMSARPTPRCQRTPDSRFAGLRFRSFSIFFSLTLPLHVGCEDAPRDTSISAAGLRTACEIPNEAECNLVNLDDVCSPTCGTDAINALDQDEYDRRASVRDEEWKSFREQSDTAACTPRHAECVDGVCTVVDDFVNNEHPSQDGESRRLCNVEFLSPSHSCPAAAVANAPHRRDASRSMKFVSPQSMLMMTASHKRLAELTTGAFIGLPCDQPLDERCLAIFERIYEECPRNVGVFVEPDPQSSSECKDLIKDECRNYSDRSADRALAERCEAEADCESFDGDMPESFETIFAPSP
jgi:hypothetical protein